jgi:uncharacterized membrane protein
MLPQAWSLGAIGWFGILPTVFASLAMVGIAAAIVLAVQLSAKRKKTVDGVDLPTEDTPLSPREILQIRYVCGEITRDQYYQMLEDLH